MSNIGLSVDGSIKRMQTGLYGYLRFFYTYKNKINLALAIALIAQNYFWLLLFIPR